jgi:uncharacterized protein YqhQ
METFTLIAANFFSGIICLIIGLIIQTGKVNFLIAGYNSLSEEEQAKWDAKAMSKFIGWVILIIPSIILLIACIPIWLDIFPVVALTVSWSLFTLIMVGGVIYMNCSSSFKHTKQNRNKVK